MKAKITSNVRGILFINLSDLNISLRENESYFFEDYEKYMYSPTLQNLINIKKVNIVLNPKEEIKSNELIDIPISKKRRSRAPKKLEASL